MRPTRCHGLLLDEWRDDRARVVEVVHEAVCLGTHAHDCIKLSLLLEGGASERNGSEIHVPRRFDIFARAAWSPHENHYHAAGARSLVVELDPDNTRLRALFADSRALLLPGAGRRLYAAVRAPRWGRRAELRHTIDEIIEKLTMQARLPGWLRDARDHLAACAADPPSLEDLARRAGVHPVHLAQSFRSRLGTTVRAFVRAHRVFAAAQMIVGGAPLAEAAQAAGFCDQSHLTRAFAAERGAPPGAMLQP